MSQISGRPPDRGIRATFQISHATPTRTMEPDGLFGPADQIHHRPQSPPPPLFHKSRHHTWPHSRVRRARALNRCRRRPITATFFGEPQAECLAKQRNQVSRRPPSSGRECPNGLGQMTGPVGSSAGHGFDRGMRIHSFLRSTE